MAEKWYTLVPLKVAFNASLADLSTSEAEPEMVPLSSNTTLKYCCYHSIAATFVPNIAGYDLPTYNILYAGIENESWWQFTKKIRSSCMRFAKMPGVEEGREMMPWSP